MKLRELLSEDFSVLKDITFSTKKLKKHLKLESSYIPKKYPYIVDFYSSFYKNKLRSISNKSFSHENIMTENFLFDFLGFTNKGYAIYETEYHGERKTFHVNEDLGQTFFYPIKNGIPEVRFHFNNSDVSVISFIEIEDAYIAISEDEDYITDVYERTFKNRKGKEYSRKIANTEKKEVIEIVVQLKANTDFPYVKQIDFINDNIKTITTTKKFIDLFHQSPVVKISFKRKRTSDKRNLAIYTTDQDDNFIAIQGDKGKGYRESEDMGINIINPFIATSDDIDLFDLNYLY